MSDLSKEDLEKMGFKSFRTIEDGLTIHPDDVKAFLEWDSSPITEEERQKSKESLEFYRRWKAKQPA